MASLPRVAVVVLSSTRPPYDRLREAQETTWDSVAVDRVGTTYYCPPTLRHACALTARALDEALLDARGWDFLFRTNASSYVDKAALQVFAASRPTRRCYCGVDGGGFASGSGVLLSRDCAGALARGLPSAPTDEPDDVAMGRVLAAFGVGVTPGAARCDFWLEMARRALYGRTRESDLVLRRSYHYRCKSDTADRGKDVRAFRLIHRIKAQGRRPLQDVAW